MSVKSKRSIPYLINIKMFDLNGQTFSFYKRYSDKK